MFEFGEKHPVLFEIVLIVVAFIAAGIITAAGTIVGFPSDFSSSVGRIIVGVALLVIFQRMFTDERPFNNLAIVLPALLFAGWNLFYNLSSGNAFGGPAFFIEAALTAAAPAIFEEVIFRGISIHNLKAKGHDALACMLISALLFSAVHLTNLVGQDVATVALQVGYSLVVGMVFAAIYLKNGSVVQVMVAHFLIDFTNRIWLDEITSSSEPQIAAFVVLLAVEAAYAIWLTRGNNNAA